MYKVPDRKIRELLDRPFDGSDIRAILGTISPSAPASLETVAELIRACESSPDLQREVIRRADEVKKDVFDNKIKLFVPVYISNICINKCLYCAYRSPNIDMPRRMLTPDEFRAEIREVLSMGYRVLELVTGETPSLKEPGALATYVRIAREELDKVSDGNEKGEVILMSWTLDDEGFSSVKDAGLDGFYIWQETYDEKVFRDLHPDDSPKSEFKKRLEVFDRAIWKGIRKIGMGVLFGLGRWEYDVLATIDHGRYLEKTYGVCPDAIGVPRFKKADGAILAEAPNPVTDEQLKLATALYRLAFPQSHIFLNTREKLTLLIELLEGGGSEMNIACAVYPGGYTEPTKDRQFDFYSFPTETTMAKLQEKGFEFTYFENPTAVKI